MTHPYDDAIAAANQAMETATQQLKMALRKTSKSSPALNDCCNICPTPRGGFVMGGMDSSGYHLLESAAGLKALYVLSHVGRITGDGCEPMYLSQRFFESLVTD
ncbi:MAG: hypothetical protein U0003_02795 [Vampirovibrionales bacterium]